MTTSPSEYFQVKFEKPDVEIARTDNGNIVINREEFGMEQGGSLVPVELYFSTAPGFICYFLSFGFLLAGLFIRKVQFGGGLAFGVLAPAVVTGGSLDVGVPGQFLDGGNIGPGVEQIADKGPAHIVR